MPPLISFIIPCYNVRPDLLSACLQSITALPLTPEEREIIVVDDGSQTPVNVAPEVKLIRQHNQGLSIARNNGISRATGQYIQFVDADDKLLSPYSQIISAIRKEKPDMVMFHLTNCEKVKGSNCEIERLSNIDFLSHHNLRASACGYAFRRELLGDLRFTPHIFHEDEEFTPLLIMKAERLFITHTQAYYYRPSPGSITQKRTFRHIVKRMNDLRGVITRLHNHGGMERRVAQLTMDHLYQVMTLTRSYRHLQKEIRLLKNLGLYPLPHKNYTFKYKWFRRLIGSRLLLYAVILLKRER